MVTGYLKGVQKQERSVKKRVKNRHVARGKTKFRAGAGGIRGEKILFTNQSTIPWK
jgi:hypothetical protein